MNAVPASEAAAKAPAPGISLADAVGGPREVAGKLASVLRAGWRLAHYREIARRLGDLHARGYIPGVPSRAQVLFGGLDMVRFLFEPGALSGDRALGIGPWRHRVLRLAADPVSWFDPGGLTQDREQVIRHLLEHLHYDPRYDLQLLTTFAQGLHELERQARAVAAGAHPDCAAIRARVPDPDYHARLADCAAAVRDDPLAPLPRARARDSSGNAPEVDPRRRASFAAAARRLSDLFGFLTYCYELPSDPCVLARRFVTQRYFPE